ncbi:uncharacterized protein M6B38_106305 [Iris pallida]|uniref:Uncharacterized protein n=1 Tax=Iris pallida TaxID=29817 RepID=A0AAX6ERY3_IRIPA|nr:uncharacterized protein M6B38_106305 [Iris pallida]
MSCDLISSNICCSSVFSMSISGCTTTTSSSMFSASTSLSLAASSFFSSAISLAAFIIRAVERRLISTATSSFSWSIVAVPDRSMLTVIGKALNGPPEALMHTCIDYC